MDVGEKSVLTAAKDVIAEVVKNKLTDIKTVRNNVDEQLEKSRRTKNFVAILTADGSFDERTAKTLKYSVDDALYQINIRGSRKIPLEIRIYGKNEEETDIILETILSNIPRKWSIGQRNGTVDILTEHSNDYASNYKDGAMQSAFVEFSMEIATSPETVALLNPTSLTGGITSE